jgi:uncharacterized protein (DUF433 family)
VPSEPTRHRGVGVGAVTLCWPTTNETGLTTAAVLDREMYEAGEAARLLGVHVRTLRNWLEGYPGRSKSYPPVLRTEPTGKDILTWGEFIEAGYLTEYRKVRRVALPELRAYIDWWRSHLDVCYPLAHQQPYVGEGRALIETERSADGDDVMYRVRDGQLVLVPWAQEFVDTVEFDHTVAQRYWPAGRAGAVAIDPLRSFGAPIVDGVRTEVLFELFVAGDPIDDIAESYDLASQRVESAVRFEAQPARSITERVVA